MAEWEDVPTDSDLALTPEDDREEWLADVFRELAVSAYQAKAHDRDGFWADEPGSPKCLAAGHRPASADPFDGVWLPEDEHIDGWDRPLCLASRYGVACTACEGDCEAPRLSVDLWSLAAVTGVGVRG